MREMSIYCSARDQDVRVVVTDEPVHDGQAPVVDTELICLEIGDRCTGNLCPICAQPREVMDARLVRSGLAPSNHARVRGSCDACDRTTDMIVSIGGYVTCTECGTTRRWKLKS